MLEDAMKLPTNEPITFKFCPMSNYGYQTHCENLDCVGQLEIGKVSYLLNNPRTIHNIRVINCFKGPLYAYDWLPPAFA